jgi:hypothetical protein
MHSSTGPPVLQSRLVSVFLFLGSKQEAQSRVVASTMSSTTDDDIEAFFRARDEIRGGKR